MSSLALGLGIIMLFLVSEIKMKKAFRASLNVLYPFLTLIQFISLLFVPAEGFDSVYYVIAFIVFLLQILLLLAVNRISKIH